MSTEKFYKRHVGCTERVYVQCLYVLCVQNQLKIVKSGHKVREGTRDEEAFLYMLVLKWLRQSPSMSPAQLRAKEREIWLVHIRSMLQEKDKKVCMYEIQGAVCAL